MTIISMKYGRKRIGVAGINGSSCSAHACRTFQEYKGWDNIQMIGYFADQAEMITKQKNYQQCENFIILGAK